MGTGSGQWRGRLEPEGTIGIAGPAAQAEGLVSRAQQWSLVSSSGPGRKGGRPGTSLGLPKPSWLGPSGESLGAADSGLHALVSRQLPHQPSHPRPFLPPRKVRRRERPAV